MYLMHFAPRAIARLSANAHHALACILLAAEHSGDWPATIRFVLTVLLPKTDGGRRPIGLFPTPIRIWFRCRSDVARRWEALTAVPALFGGAGRGAAGSSPCR